MPYLKKFSITDTKAEFYTRFPYSSGATSFHKIMKTDLMYSNNRRSEISGLTPVSVVTVKRAPAHNKLCVNGGRTLLHTFGTFTAADN
jgi:hypothetical protein